MCISLSCIFFIVLFSELAFVNAQQVIGDRIYWDEVQNSDPRLDIRTRANGTNWGDTDMSEATLTK